MTSQKILFKLSHLERVLLLQLPFRIRWANVKVELLGNSFLITYFDNKRGGIGGDFHSIEKPLKNLNQVLYYERKSLFEKFRVRLSNPTYLNGINKNE